MADPAQRVMDEAVKHRIALSRYSTHLVRKVVAQLNRVELDVVARLARTDNESVSGVRLQALLMEIQNLQAGGWQVVKLRVVNDLTEVAAVEAAFADGLVQSAAPEVASDVFSPVPPVSQIMAAVQARPFQGKLLREVLDGLEASTAARVRDTIRMGFIEGQTTGDIVRALRGTKANQYKDGVLEISRRDAEAVVRTAISHTSNVAHQAVYEANADVIKGVCWVSVLDNRTTLICASRDGKVYPIDSGPRPPAHFNCRSTTVPVVAPIDGVAPFERPTYSQWLKRQSAAEQDDILGPARGALFRTGKLQVDQFIDKTGKTLTLDQLKARDAEAFRKAGLAP